MNREEREKKILIVDDEPLNRALFRSILKDYATIEAENGLDALEKVPRVNPDIILMDIMMPQMDGIEATRRLKANIDTSRIPVVIVTAVQETDVRIKALQAGGNDFILKPIHPEELLVRVQNLLKIKDFEDFVLQHNRLLQEEVERKTTELKNAFIDSVYRLTLAAEYKDEQTFSHIRRTSHYIKLMAEHLGFSAKETELLYLAAPLHDIGKMGIPDSILTKPGKLTPEEFEIIKTHTTLGEKLLKDSPSEIMQVGARIAISHHERFDGTGYPKGLRGTDIPIEGRIFNIIDQYDALRSPRPYKDALSHERTFRILSEGDERTKPEHFDPEIVKAFIALNRLFEQIYEKNRD